MIVEVFENQPDIPIEKLVCFFCCYTWICYLPIPLTIILLSSTNLPSWLSGILIGLSCIFCCLTPHLCVSRYFKKVMKKRDKILEIILGNEILDVEEVGSDILCTICLSNLEVGDMYTKLCCDHMYHRECIKTWLQMKVTCPICRRKL
tara:strand:+ start:653 stop:1096 length:444 start_codon:yes stop_codon:yes gene_type:complete